MFSSVKSTSSDKKHIIESVSFHLIVGSKRA